MKRTKITASILAMALIFSSFFCLSALAEGKSSVPSAQIETKPEIISKNIYYQGNYALALAVDSSTVKGGSVTVEVFDSNKTTKIGSYTSNVSENITVAGETKNVYVIKTMGIAAVNMAKQYYFRAADAEGNIGDLERYSVAEYMYERTYLCDSTENQLKLYEAILKMGASAQKVLINETDTNTSNDVTLVTDYRLVTVNSGKLSDGYTQGIYPVGAAVTIVPDEADTKWQVRNLRTKIKSDEISENRIIVDNHISVDVAFERGNGKYYTENEKISLDYNRLENFEKGLDKTHVYRVYDTFYYDGEETLTNCRAYVKTIGDIDKVLGVHVDDVTREDNYSALVPGLLFKPMTEDESKTTYVFESDIWFGTVSGYLNAENADIEQGAVVFGFDVSDKFHPTDTKFRNDHFDKLSSLVTMEVRNGVVVGYNVFGEFVGAEEWCNIRITFDSSNGVYRTYLNGEIKEAMVLNIADVTYASVWARRMGGNSAMRLDNTYFGTYEADPSEPLPDISLAPAEGEYFNETAADHGDYTFYKYDYRLEKPAFWSAAAGVTHTEKNGALYATPNGGTSNPYSRIDLLKDINGDGKIDAADGYGEDLNGDGEIKDGEIFVKGNVQIFETDIMFEGGTLTTADTLLGWAGLCATGASNSTMYTRFSLYAVLGAEVEGGKVIDAVELDTGAGKIKLDTDKWYNLRIVATVTDGNYLVDIYVDGENKLSGCDITSKGATDGSAHYWSVQFRPGASDTKDFSIVYDNTCFGLKNEAAE